MKIKRYFAENMRDAMRRVRDDQGPDAVILGSSSRDGGIELVAAIDYDEALLQQAMRRGDTPPREPQSATATKADAVSVKAAGREKANPKASPAAAERAPAAGDVTSSAMARRAQQLVWAQDPHLRRLQTEMQDMRKLLADALAQQTDITLRAHPSRARALEMLARIGIDPALAREIAADVPDGEDSARARALPAGLLARRLPVLSDARVTRATRLALIGPTGAGKTTTLAKLAARAVAEVGARNVALITLDGHRAGAEAQIGVYARLLGVPLRVARGVDGLAAALEACADCSRVFIDTAGVGPADTRLAALLPELARLAGTHDLQSLLVLPANVQREDLLMTWTRFAPARPMGAVLTKIDECTRLGGAISALIGSRLPLVWLGDGQSVPRDLHRASSTDLVMRAVRLARTASESESQHAVKENACA